MMRLVFFSFTTACLAFSSEAFVMSPSRSVKSSTELAASRREFLTTGMVGVIGTVFPGSAEASYSAYVNREKDWEDRQVQGKIQYKTARDLRAQLREIVPANSEGSKIFCPNGPSAAVSPIMENRCSDMLANPSIFGRSNDIVGNSIPGFK